jgi:hypothetical protein
MLVWNNKTNELATYTGNTIHTYFRPKKGQKYVDNVILRDGYTIIP